MIYFYFYDDFFAALFAISYKIFNERTKVRCINKFDQLYYYCFIRTLNQSFHIMKHWMSDYEAMILLFLSRLQNMFTIWQKYSAWRVLRKLELYSVTLAFKQTRYANHWPPYLWYCVPGWGLLKCPLNFTDS